MQFAVCKFGCDDGTVHQHAHHKDQREQNHNIHRVAHRPQRDDTRKKCTRNRQSHQNGRPCAQSEHNHHHHKDHRGNHVRFQIGQHVFDLFGLVLQIGNFDAFRPIGAQCFYPFLYRCNRFNDVRARAFRDFQRQCGLPVDARKRIRVLERTADRGHIAKGHHSIAAHLDGHRHDVFQILDEAGDLEYNPARAGFNGASSNQAVVALDLPDQFVK